MKSGFFACALFILLTPAAYANSPVTVDGPPGCGWRATVADVTHGDDTVIDLVLSQRIATCAFNPGPCGNVGDQLPVHQAKDSARTYRAGQIAEVWVTGKDVSFDQPTCTRAPE